MTLGTWAANPMYCRKYVAHGWYPSSGESAPNLYVTKYCKV